MAELVFQLVILFIIQKASLHRNVHIPSIYRAHVQSYGLAVATADNPHRTAGSVGYTYKWLRWSKKVHTVFIHAYVLSIDFIFHVILVDVRLMWRMGSKPKILQTSFFWHIKGSYNTKFF
jgi:hypothetical protein